MIWRCKPHFIYMLSLLAMPLLGHCINSHHYSVNELTDIQGVDVYKDGPILHLVLVGKEINSSEERVVYLHSNDGGETWGKPVVINQKGDGKVVSRRGNEAQVAASGKRNVYREWGWFCIRPAAVV